jgi:hypothetical protein
VSGFATALAIALAVGLAAPAEAAGKHKKRNAFNPGGGTATQTSQYGAPDWGGGAQGSGPLYFGQEYLGTDPDPGIRFQLMKDITGRYGGGGD